ncbi:MAG TPA: hypothetical protein VI011_20065 [Asanoa sp.]
MSGVVVYPAKFGGQPEQERTAGLPAQDPAVLWRFARLVLEAIVRSVAAAEGALSPPPARLVAVDVLIGGAAVAGELVGQFANRLAHAGRSIGGGVLSIAAGERTGAPPALSRLAERGRRERAAAGADLERLAATLVPAVTAAVLDRLDLTALVRDRVKLDALVAEVDVDAVVARVDLDAVAARLDVDTVANRIDLDAIVDRLDLVALASRTIEGIDLAGIIRESTGSVTDDVVRGVRMQGIQADQAVARLVARLLRRKPVPSDVDGAVPRLGAPS